MVTGSSFILLKRGRERERRRGKKGKRRKRKREKATRKPDFTPKVAQLPFQPRLSVVDWGLLSLRCEAERDWWEIFCAVFEGRFDQTTQPFLFYPNALCSTRSGQTSQVI